MTQVVRCPCRATRRPFVLVPVLALLIVAGLLPSPATAQEVPPEKVDASVQKAVAWIYSQQKPTGQWEKDLTRTGTGHDWQSMQGETFGGYSALCVYALLEAGEKPTEPRLVKGVEFLRTCDMFGTYAVGLRAMVFSRLPPTAQNKAVLQRDADRLLSGIIRNGAARGLWDYSSGLPGGRGNSGGEVDLSISQFGVLGLWSAAKAGIAIPPETWKLFDEVWRKHQLPDGAWSYDGTPGSVRPTITAAGVATLLIVQDVLGSAGAGVPASDQHLTKGIKKLGTMFKEVQSSGAYAWYAVERIGTAGGIRYIATHDWYDVGTKALLKSQQPDGSWPAGAVYGMDALSETAISVLFLVHGRAPTVVAKLDYSAVADGTARNAEWNRRPRDAANLAKYMANVLEQPLNWRVISVRASREEMLESPVVLISGAKDLTLVQRERDVLKSYIDSGGLVIAAAEARAGGTVGEDDFSKSVIRLAQQMYPTYRFRELPESHPIFTEQQFRAKSWKERPTLWGLSNGVRELIVLFPEGDYGQTWNANQVSSRMKFDVGANVVQYSITRTPTRAGTGSRVKPNYLWDPEAGAFEGGAATAPTSAPATQPGGADVSTAATQPMGAPKNARYVTVGRLKVGENWDPEPGAWQRLSVLLANDHKVFATIKPVELDAAQLKDVKVLHWTGTTSVKLTDAQRAALLGFVNGGGTLVVDAAGGSAAFADAAQAELIAMLNVKTDAIGTILAEDDPLYRLREAKIDKFEYRRFMAARATGKLNAPRVRGVDRSGRTLLFFSREDITGGCVGQNTDGILGYTPATATAIMRNIVLTAVKK